MLVLKAIAYQMRKTYPASIWVEKSPPYAIFPNLSHAPAAIEKNSQHAFSEFYYARILLCLGWFRCVIRHTVLLWYRWDNEGRMEVDECLPEGSEVRISSSNL